MQRHQDDPLLYLNEALSRLDRWDHWEPYTGARAIDARELAWGAECQAHAAEGVARVLWVLVSGTLWGLAGEWGEARRVAEWWRTRKEQSCRQSK